MTSRSALALLAALAVTSARAEWEAGATAGVSYDNNLTRAQDAVDKRAAASVTANANASYFHPFAASDSATFIANAGVEIFDRYSGLANASVGGTATYRHKFGVGPLVPWVSTSVHLAYEGYRESLRTSTFVDARAEAGTRASEELDVSAAVYYERRYDNHGESIVPGISGKVFDLAGQGLDARAGYAMNDALYFDFKAGVRRGDVESTSQRSLQIFLASSAITDDPVWGDPELYAYRLRGTTYTGALTASYALSNRSSLDLAYQYAFTRAAQGLEYATNTVSLTFVYRH